jgi:hypothetical protein
VLDAPLPPVPEPPVPEPPLPVLLELALVLAADVLLALELVGVPELDPPLPEPLVAVVGPPVLEVPFGPSFPSPPHAIAKAPASPMVHFICMFTSDAPSKPVAPNDKKPAS